MAAPKGKELLHRLQDLVRRIKDDSTKSSAPNSLPAVNPSNPLVGRLCDLIASIFNDGLEKKWYRGADSAWAYMQTISPSATIDSIDKLPGLTTDAAKCKAWVRLALNECSLVGILDTVQSNPDDLRKYYAKVALLADSAFVASLREALSPLVSVSFNIPLSPGQSNEGSRAAVKPLISLPLASRASVPMAEGDDDIMSVNSAPSSRRTRRRPRVESNDGPAPSAGPQPRKVSTGSHDVTMEDLTRGHMRPAGTGATRPGVAGSATAPHDRSSPAGHPGAAVTTRPPFGAEHSPRLPRAANRSRASSNTSGASTPGSRPLTPAMLEEEPDYASAIVNVARKASEDMENLSSRFGSSMSIAEYLSQADPVDSIPESLPSEGPSRDGEQTAAVSETAAPGSETSLGIVMPAPAATAPIAAEHPAVDQSEKPDAHVGVTESFIAMAQAVEGAGIDNERAAASICELYLKAKAGPAHLLESPTLLAAVHDFDERRSHAADSHSAHSFVLVDFPIEDDSLAPAPAPAIPTHPDDTHHAHLEVPRPGRKSSAGQGQGDVFSNRAGDRHGARSEAAIPDQDEACGPGQAGAAAHTRVLLPRIRALLLAQAVVHFLQGVMRICPQKGLDAQDYKCVACHADIGLAGDEALLDDYLGLYFCGKCLVGERHLMPARVLHNWDLRQQLVSRRSRVMLSYLYDMPVYDLLLINPKLTALVPVITRVRHLRKQLAHAKDIVLTCKPAVRVDLLSRVGYRYHYLETRQLFSLRDLSLASQGHLEPFLRKATSWAIEHVLECQLCSLKGSYCEYCQSDSIIYPFYLNDTVQCGGCKALAHRECFKEGECPKCERIRKLKEKRASSNNSPSPGT